MTRSYTEYFAALAGLPTGVDPHPWQHELAEERQCVNRLVRVPTGFGKTFGVLGAWLWNRVEQRNALWPRRVVWCLPMRVLVEQVVAEARAALARLGADAQGIEAHALMGGVEGAEWHLQPHREAVLIGTQDMLLSRAMNRGYGAPRARWPMDFGLLNQDCLWVMDEVQLMDVGLATSAQLQAFREEEEARGTSLRLCKTWWMSATLQRAWLDSSPDTRDPLRDLPQTRILPAQRSGPLWDESAVRKPLQIKQIQQPGKHAHAGELAKIAAEAHTSGGRGACGPTLVVVNRVERAVEIYKALAAAASKSLRGTDLRLVHSRFRAADRAHWREAFLNRAACAPGVDRIIVATQVVEAGVDISAGVLVTELAPWPSLVQRFGRCARYGGHADVLVFDALAKDAGTAAPYEAEALEAARGALSLLGDVTPKSLEAFEEAHPELTASLYPYRPAHLLLRHEVDELFDTSPDLSGADVDVSRFIRTGDERDLSLFWLDVPKGTTPGADQRPRREALCAVPFLAARDWLCGKETSSSKVPRLARGRRAWVWDYLSGRWRTAERRDLYPGQTALVAADTGGYDAKLGWSPASAAPVPEVPTVAGTSAQDLADASEDDESLSAVQAWQTIATHGAQVGREAAALSAGLGQRYERLLDLAGRWHDAGKALAPFQNSIVGEGRPARADLAKAPQANWLPVRRLYPDPPHARRAGFRHELASTLALFDVLARHQPDHVAMVGPWLDLLRAAERRIPEHTASAAAPNPLEQEVLGLDAADFDLLAYLVCAHHGKVRLAWHASPADQEAGDTVLRLRGVRDGEELPALTLAVGDGSHHRLPPSRLRLDAAAAGLNPITGRGWTERTLGLLAQHGPFALAYLEALLRAADQRASRVPVEDPVLEPDNAPHGLEASHRELAPAEPAGAPSPAVAAHSAQRGAEHGLRGGAGELGSTGSGTRAPPHATRQVDTARCKLTYAELAPLLAERVAAIERAIESGEFDDRALDDELIRQLHTRLCGDLVPVFAGWRRRDVVIGGHEPPPHFKVPMAMHEYALDLAARLDHLDARPDLLPEFLAFAEGRLLSIHPFADFNGRATRMFLRLVLRRLELPAVDLVPPAEATAEYLRALAAGDRADWVPLAAVWRQRLTQGDPA
ncbi:MAG: Fic family protein [Rubrivivax sp.]|nr:Fic family protein [Rubrivivax sp.]